MVDVYNIFPGQLPLPTVRETEFGRIDVASIQNREQGDARKTSRFTFAPRTIEASWLLTQQQFDVWWSWFEKGLRAGELIFPLPMPVLGKSGQTITRDLVKEAVQFIEPYSVTCHQGAIITYTVRASFVVWGSWDLITQASGSTVFTGFATIAGEAAGVAETLRASGATTFRGIAIILSPAIEAAGSSVFSGRAIIT